MKATLSINKSRLFRRAWYLVRERMLTISEALKIVWCEMKEYAMTQIRIAEETERINKWQASDEYKALMATPNKLDCSEYYHGAGSANRYYGD